MDIERLCRLTGLRWEPAGQEWQSNTLGGDGVATKDMASFAELVRREALEEAAKFLEKRAAESWRGVREGHTIMCCAEWVRDTITHVGN